MNKFMLKMIISWWIMLITLLPLYSQENDVQFERISTESGLSQSTVLCIYQDRKGFLWIGTFEGLNRYDGYDFKVFKSDSKNLNSISNNSINSIIEDHLGILWVGTEDGLNYYNRENEKFIRYKNDPSDSSSLSNNYIRCVYEDRSGTLWVGTNGGGLNRFDREKKQFIRYEYDPGNSKSIDNNNVLSILEDKQKRLWIGTDGGLNYFNRDKKEFINYKNNPGDPHSIGPNGIWTIYEDHLENLWLGSWGGGLNKFDPKTGVFVKYQNNPKDPTSLSDNIVRCIYEDRKGNLWIGTANKGLNKFISGSGRRERDSFVCYLNDPLDPMSLSSNSVISIYEDKLGILWIGTNFGGINKYSPNKRQFERYSNRQNDENSLAGNFVQAILEDNQGMIWIGTDGKGLDCLDRKNNQFKHYVNNPKDPNSLSNNIIKSICKDNFNDLWIGTVDGLNYFNRKEGKFICYRNDPLNPRSISHSTAWSVYKDRAGDIWIGTFGGGLNRFNFSTGEFARYVRNQNDSKSINDNFIWTIHEDLSGIFWIGTLVGGLNRFDPKSEVFSHYLSDIHDTSSISNNKILCLYEDHSGVIWAGTINGLNKFDRNTGMFYRYSESDGLSNNNVQGILEDDHGNLWIGTNYGLSKFNPRTLKFNNYYESNGLQSNEFAVNSCCKLKSGEMVFGGMKGFSIFHPDSIKDDTTLPNVVITGFNIFNKPVVVGENTEGRIILKKSISECDEVQLSYKDNVFSFEFAALHFVSPKENLYAYMMEGFEKEWNYTDANRRFVTYTNLERGEYTFRVKASNNQGYWNDEGASIRIVITPPFWETLWFRLTMLAAFLGMVFWIYKWRMQLRELSTQKRIDAVLTKERNLLRTLIDNIPDAIYVKDAEFRKTIANTAHVRNMHCNSESEVLGKNDYELLPKETAEKNYAEDRSVIDSGEPMIDREIDITDEKGEKKWIQSSKIPLYDDNKKIIGIVGVLRDITQRKKSEEERERLITELKDALADVKLLSGLVPICANCKKIRDDQGYWTQIESYIQDRSDAKFSHSICPDCAAKIYPNYNIKNKEE